jgi:hypothetical protein
MVDQQDTKRRMSKIFCHSSKCSVGSSKKSQYKNPTQKIQWKNIKEYPTSTSKLLLKNKKRSQS